MNKNIINSKILRLIHNDQDECIVIISVQMLNRAGIKVGDKISIIERGNEIVIRSSLREDSWLMKLGDVVRHRITGDFGTLEYSTFWVFYSRLEGRRKSVDINSWCSKRSNSIRMRYSR